VNAAVFLLSLLGVYLLLGVAFAIPFVAIGVKRIDPHAASATWGFRLLIVPGIVVLWPLLLRRWMRGAHEPPEEQSAHRCAARQSCRNRCEQPQTP
jgi:membrane protein implicated in regulation of membrane protease activity